jgi:hypothetical protein
LRAAISAALALVAAAALQAAPPRFGGTLRVKLRSSRISLDPREWTPGSLNSSDSRKIASLVYDRLVTLNDYGQFQPALATEWTHDATFKTWHFKLRAGVHFSDGSALTPALAAAALQSTSGKNFEIAATEAGLTIHSLQPAPDILEQLASGNDFIFRAQLDGKLLGTGPFLVAEAVPEAPAEANPLATKPARIKLLANENCWAGRPFVDVVEVTLGEPALRQLLDLQVNRAEIAEITPDLVRKGREEGLRIWNSAPLVLVALRFDDALAAPASDSLHEALWLAIDRDTMANVLLQRQAQLAAALLPQWLTGYAFLFESPMNLPRAKELRASFPAGVAGAEQALRLHVDAPGDLFKLMGERVAVNARQANLLVQVAGVGSANNTAAPSDGLHLFAWHYDSLSPRTELETLLRQMPDGSDLGANAADPEQLFAQERRLLEEHRILPLVVLPEYVGLRANVHNWNGSPWGDWRLADVWLEAEDTSSGKAAGSTQKENMPARTPGANQ